ncbi:MAG: pyrimidine 5'-nucleotidase [Gammaproteobacteria bacterium]|nr:pyrimidine 5'-nucleotidase [Gammaproteobacteria bacterium]MBU1601064.1 pyrimidine 5'-nucleotidase [Gammaproteobacteria bacterium]MBU2434423.1 pyrimidine 5'-nucleotidase [Gammaproteobacteria bacterium]MBU2450827.1 pyrimidine 5'-nucleotidase [Gammaproteobacteria bacterium]
MKTPIWLFDLDNTLHNATPHIFPHINRSMREYIERHLGVDEHEANRIRQGYWVRYGATLLGLIRHHGTDPRHFLRETHQFPDLARMVVFDKPLLHTLRLLPGRKIIFSNAPRHYAEAVLDITGLGRYFDAVYTVENLRFQPKPMLAGFRTLLRAEHLDPRRCIMVEDSLANLVTAKKLGMKTVWVSAGLRQSPYVDAKIRSATQLSKCYGRLEISAKNEI